VNPRVSRPNWKRSSARHLKKKRRNCAAKVPAELNADLQAFEARDRIRLSRPETVSPVARSPCEAAFCCGQLSFILHGPRSRLFSSATSFDGNSHSALPRPKLVQLTTTQGLHEFPSLGARRKSAIAYSPGGKRFPRKFLLKAAARRNPSS